MKYLRGGYVCTVVDCSNNYCAHIITVKSKFYKYQWNYTIKFKKC